MQASDAGRLEAGAGGRSGVIARSDVNGANLHAVSRIVRHPARFNFRSGEENVAVFGIGLCHSVNVFSQFLIACRRGSGKYLGRDETIEA